MSEHEMVDDDESCDYCGRALPERHYLRAVGWSAYPIPSGARTPLVKSWCDICEPPYDIDPDADLAMRIALERQGRHLNPGAVPNL